ncbi:MAG: SprB repeat-containing protein, partial [Flavobacteriales bacterium]|nr:SprB repeat-containing protein [Flavobacteriales bacterium]
SGGINLVSSLQLETNCNLTIDNGHIWSNGQTITLEGNIDINNDGFLNLNDNSVLNINNTGEININSGGKLITLGSESNEVTIQSNDGTYWEFECFSNGSVSAEWTIFDELDNWGVYIYSGAFIDILWSFNHCTFLPGQSGGALLWINNDEAFSINYANFPSQGTSSYNVRKTYNTGNVYLINSLGSFAGEAYDYDNYNRVDWTNDIYIAGVVTNALCNGDSNGEIDITLSGGTAGYSYLWSDGSTFGDRSGLTAGTYTITATDYYGAEETASYTITEPAVYTVGLWSQTNVTCNGGNDGTISINLTGGTYPDVILWSNGNTTGTISNLTAGTYSITCTDVNDCIATNSWTITEPDAIAVSAVITNIACYGTNSGAINITVTGGTPGYTYVWSDGSALGNRTNLAAGNYTITATDTEGCTQEETFVVTQPLELLIGNVITYVSCAGGNDGSFQTSVSGGTSPYSYLWSNGATTVDILNLTTGLYHLTLTDTNGCVNILSGNVGEPALPLSVSASVVDANCNGASNGSISLSVSGGTSPYYYSWSNGATTQNISGLSAGTYSITVEDASGCTSVEIIGITEPDAIQLSGAITSVDCDGGTNGSIYISVSGGVSPYAYIWSNGTITNNPIGLSADFYSVTVTDANSCTQTALYQITEPTILVTNITQTNVDCNGASTGSATVIASGGTAPYSYFWYGSPAQTTATITGLYTGDYPVLVTDVNGCTSTTSAIIAEPNLYVVFEIIHSNVTCNGGSDGAISINLDGGTLPDVLIWSNGSTDWDLTNLTVGTYSVTCTDANG